MQEMLKKADEKGFLKPGALAVTMKKPASGTAPRTTAEANPPTASPSSSPPPHSSSPPPKKRQVPVYTGGNTSTTENVTVSETTPRPDLILKPGAFTHRPPK
jgi:hypothetical protein